MPSPGSLMPQGVAVSQESAGPPCLLTGRGGWFQTLAPGSSSRSGPMRQSLFGAGGSQPSDTKKASIRRSVSS